MNEKAIKNWVGNLLMFVATFSTGVILTEQSEGFEMKAIAAIIVFIIGALAKSIAKDEIKAQANRFKYFTYKERRLIEKTLKEVEGKQFCRDWGEQVDNLEDIVPTHIIKKKTKVARWIEICNFEGDVLACVAYPKPFGEVHQFINLEENKPYKIKEVWG